MDLVTNRLKKLREEFIDTAFGACVLAGTFTQIVTLFRDYPDYINYYTWVRFSLLLLFSGIFYFRRYLSGDLKIFLLVFLMFILFSFSVFNLGFYSTLKLFIVFGPVTLVFLLRQTVTIVIASFFSMIYFLGSWILMDGHQKYMIPPQDLIIDIFHWSTELGFSVLCIISIIFMIYRFRFELNNSIGELESKNSELEGDRLEIAEYNSGLEKMIDQKTSELQKAVNDLAIQNRELKAQNLSIQKYNEEIKDATSKLEMVRERMLMSDKLSSLGLLTAGVCHEIKNPLNHLYGSSRILEDLIKTSESSGDQLKLLSAISEGVFRIKTIIDSLNQFDHSLPHSKGSVDIILVIENCRRILSHLFKAGINYKFESRYSKVEVAINPDSLHQILLNVMQNAAEALEDKGTVQVMLLVSEDKVIAEISDDGLGIPEEQISSVTEPFFTTKSTNQHTGLGMYHVQKMLNEVGGRMIIDSELGRGTIVRLVFTTQVITKA